MPGRRCPPETSVPVCRLNVFNEGLPGSTVDSLSAPIVEPSFTGVHRKFRALNGVQLTSAVRVDTLKRRLSVV